MKEKQMDNTLAGYILAGGKNTRMGGRKKLFLKYRGKQFYLWLKNGLKAAGALYVSVEEYAPYEGLDEVLVKDIYKGTGPSAESARG